MGIRTLCFVAAVIVGHGVVMWILIVGALLLPYVAVVMANAAACRSDDFALQGSAFDTTRARVQASGRVLRCPT